MTFKEGLMTELVMTGGYSWAAQQQFLTYHLQSTMFLQELGAGLLVQLRLFDIHRNGPGKLKPINEK